MISRICDTCDRSFRFSNSDVIWDVHFIAIVHYLRVVASTMLAAEYPAPKPLSMFTTVMPGEQLFNIARRAAIPPKLAPYPMLVGTAIMGQLTKPPMTGVMLPPFRRQLLLL